MKKLWFYTALFFLCITSVGVCAGMSVYLLYKGRAAEAVYLLLLACINYWAADGAYHAAMKVKS